NTYSKSIEPGNFRSFAVSAEGKVTASPDIAQFNFSIISEGYDLSKIQKENTEKTNKSIEFLKNQGIDPKDIKTQYYNISPKYTYYNCFQAIVNNLESKPCPPPKISGYTITQTINVKIKDFSKIGNILSGIVEYGANNVSDLQFSVNDQSKLENEAREEAIKKAQEKAKNIAKSAGFKLGKLLSIEEGEYYYPIYKTYAPSNLGMGGGSDASMSNPQVEPGSQEIKVNVTLRYGIE
ncbi:MAG: SIMPL domain-containing protein, partial [bacterium]|nr:SIMPL domain-containing protein [bacterium]